jgi:hypothetical protein
MTENSPESWTITRSATMSTGVSFEGSPMSGFQDPRRNPDAVQEAEAREQRRRIVRAVVHSSGMEGLPLDVATLALFERYIDGLMTTAQLREAVLQQYRAGTVSD